MGGFGGRGALLVIYVEKLTVEGPRGWRGLLLKAIITRRAEGGRGCRLLRLGTEGFESKDLGLKAQAFPWQRLQGPLVFPVGCPGLQARQEVRPRAGGAEHELHP